MMADEELNDQEGIVEFTTREEYINCACYCLNTVNYSFIILL